MGDGEVGASFWAVFGLVLMAPPALIAITALRARRRQRTWRRTEATVTRIGKRKERTTEGGVTTTVSVKVAHYRFRDAVGNEHHGVETHPGRLRKGSTLEIVHHPENPQLNESAGLGIYVRWLLILVLPFLLGAYAFQ